MFTKKFFKSLLKYFQFKVLLQRVSFEMNEKISNFLS